MTTSTAIALHELGVCDAANLIAHGEVSPLDLAEALLARIAATEPKLKAWAYLDPDAVRAEAAILTEEAKAGKLRGPLHGVPIAFKDEFLVKGMPTKVALSWKDVPLPAEDATPVARLRAAGALIMGTLYMPDRFGSPPTRNPWNLEHTPGGSSSGCAAAVGARVVPISLGEQTGGSNNRPAAFCGVLGIKPTFGRVSRYNMYPFTWSLDHPGIIGRSIQDMALVLSIISGYDPRDPASLDEPTTPATVSMDGFRPPRIGVMRDYILEKADPVMRDCIEESVAKLAAAGAEVKDVPLSSDFPLIWPVWAIVNRVEGATYHAAHHIEIEAKGGDISAQERQRRVNSRLGELIPATYYLQAQRIRGKVRAMMLDTFGEVDLLLTPTATGAAPKGTGGGGNVFNSPFASVGFPSMTLPGGLSPEGMPLGLQFSAAPLEEYRLLQAGLWIEEVIGKLPPPPMDWM